MSRRRSKAEIARDRARRDRSRQSGGSVDGTKPLRHPRREAFVQRFWSLADPEQSAREAGYGRKVAARIWPFLLADPRIKARLRELRRAVMQPAPRTSEVLDALMQRAFVDLSDLVRVNPRTGEARVDLRGASPAQINALNITQKTREVDGKRQVTTTVSTPDRSREIAIIARRLGLYEADLRNEKPDPLLQLIDDVIRHGSKVPIVHDPDGDETGPAVGGPA